jgi:hypothetical protein
MVKFPKEEHTSKLAKNDSEIQELRNAGFRFESEGLNGKWFI